MKSKMVIICGIVLLVCTSLVFAQSKKVPKKTVDSQIASLVKSIDSCDQTINEALNNQQTIFSSLQATKVRIRRRPKKVS